MGGGGGRGRGGGGGGRGVRRGGGGGGGKGWGGVVGCGGACGVAGAVGARRSFYPQALEIGRGAVQVVVGVWRDGPLSSEGRKVTEAVFVFVAIDGSGRTRSVPRR